MATYQEIKSEQPELVECFFAFSTKQYDEGLAQIGVEKSRMRQAYGGLYGTNEGIQKLFDFYEKMDSRIALEIAPQEVYNYEFNNHECSYTCDDSEAMKITISYFEPEQYNEVKRKYKYYTNEELLVQIEKEAQKKLIIKACR